MKTRLDKSVCIMAFCGLLFGTLNGATYSENYNVLKSDSSALHNDNRFMNGNFEAIYRYEMIVFKNKEMQRDSQATLDKALEKLKELQSNAKDFTITLIGHTRQATDDANEKSVESDAYASSIQNLFKKSLSSDESMRLSQEYADYLKEKLISSDISEEKIYTEARGAKDQVFTEVYTAHKERSHGVFLSIYVDEVPEARKEPIKVEPAKIIQSPVPKVDKPKVPVKIETLKLNFETNSDVIMQSSFGEIERFAAFLKEHTEYNVKIVGHTDGDGGEAFNLDLSQRRALATKRALVEKGVDAMRLQSEGHGELKPIASNYTQEGKAANRRVEAELFLKNR